MWNLSFGSFRDSVRAKLRSQITILKHAAHNSGIWGFKVPESQNPESNSSDQ